MIAATDAWGPFAADIDPAKRRARCRCLRAIVHLSTGRRGDELAAHLRQAERDPEVLPLAVVALNRLAGLDRRHVLAHVPRRLGVAAMPHRPGPLSDMNDEPTDLTEPARHELVAEAAVIFGHDAARELAALLRISFEGAVAEASQ
jgi:hypothetical protein